VKVHDVGCLGVGVVSHLVAGLCETLYHFSRKVRLTMIYDDIEMFATSCIKGHIYVIKGHIHVILGLCNI
jgi:hypothetical protein